MRPEQKAIQMAVNEMETKSEYEYSIDGCIYRVTRTVNPDRNVSYSAECLGLAVIELAIGVIGIVDHDNEILEYFIKNIKNSGDFKFKIRNRLYNLNVKFDDGLKLYIRELSD